MSPKKTYVIGPNGSPLRLADLPSSNTYRWVPRRKAEVVCAVEGGLISKASAFNRYNLDEAEWAEWQTHYHKDGLPGLRTTHTQDYRK